MSTESLNPAPPLGLGLGLRGPHIAEILAAETHDIWFEIISENYMVDGGPILNNLDRILERYKVVQHGVGMYLGSAQGLNRDHLQKLKKLLRRTGSPWVTDHLCWGSVDGSYSHDLLPLPYNAASIRCAVQNIREAQDFLECPLAVENISAYTQFAESEMPEWEFVREVIERADVGLLLDLNNVYVNALNHGFDARYYVSQLPLQRVRQIHLAGFSYSDKVVIDTHDHPVSDPVWALYQQVIAEIGPTPTLLEWDARLPSFSELLSEVEKARHFWPDANGGLAPLRQNPLLKNTEELRHAG